jgi:hypothetical protein
MLVECLTGQQDCVFRVNVQCFKIVLCYAVPHNNRYTILLENISLHFALQQVFLSVFFLHPVPYSTPSSPNAIVLHFSVFAKAVSRLMHSIHCGSTIFPYQVLERKPAQDTLIGCAGRII